MTSLLTRLVLSAIMLTVSLGAQTPQPQVIFERNAATPATPSPSTGAAPEITDAERSAVSVSAYDLDARLNPAASRLAMRARITARNTGSTSLTRIALEISSSLTWESATLMNGHTRTRLSLTQHMLVTDADHTGKASEAILTLPEPLAPGAEVMLDTFYSGTITQNADRLERIGATTVDATESDWDAITETTTALRGFGNVLWYPVASTPLFLGQGAQLFEAVGQAKLRGFAIPVTLRLSVDYDGAPPIAAYFCGRRAALTPVGGDLENVPGIATATFPVAPLGFRTLSLFVIPERETRSSPQPGGWSLLAVAAPSLRDTDLAVLAATAEDSASLLTDWLGPQPLSALTVIDHAGQPFEDGPLLVARVAALTAPDAAAAMTHSLTHSWVQTGSPWIDEGLAEFFVLLQTERTRGREAAVAQLETLLTPLVLAEPAPEAGKSAPVGQPLTAASSDLYYRRKAAAIFWMLRGITGDDALKQALHAFRTRPPSHNKPEDDALIFESLLEKTYAKDLHWFFDDWVLHDRGLPDLSIADVTPRELPPSVATRNTNPGWLVSVTVRNDGAAVADVPLVIRSGSFSTTQRLRIGPFAAATTRVLVEAPPTEIILNDGTTPEQRASTHTRTINVRTH